MKRPTKPTRDRSIASIRSADPGLWLAFLAAASLLASLAAWTALR